MSLGTIDPVSRRAFVKARIIGPRAPVDGNFLIDTGCPVTSIDPELIAWAGYSVRQGKRRSRLVGPGEGVSEGWVLEINAFEAFGVRHEGFEVHVHEHWRADGIDGLLGMDFLLAHVLTVDGPAGTIELLR